MLGFFRRIINSKIGVVVTFVVLGVIALAFAAGDVTGLGHGTGGMTASTVAHVGEEDIGEAELVGRAKQALQSVQQRSPTADMAGLLAANGVERLLDQLVTARAFEVFAHDEGMVVSKRSVDGEIASIPAFRGADGKFSQINYEGALAQQKVTDAQVRDDIARERLIQQLTAPANGGARAPRLVAQQYAALLLERRRGAIGVIPSGAVPAGPAPTEAEIAAFYRANIARNTIPERRVIRYAIVSPDSVKAQATPSDAELAAAYRAAPARFAARQTRSAELAVVLDQATANGLATRARSGTSLLAAARALGLEGRSLTKLDKAAFATQTSPAVADAVFAGAPDAVVGPLRAAGSFTVAKLTAVETVPAKSLDQARAELLPEVARQKQAAVLNKLNDALDNSASEGASFDEMLKAQQLSAQKTAAVLPNGIDPLNPKVAPDPQLAAILQAGFAAEPGDSPQIVPVGTEGGFALVAVDTVVPAAARPLAEIRDNVVKALILSRQQAAARKLALAVVAKVNAGTPFATALAQTGVSLPRARPIDAPRAAIASAQGSVDPALVMLFAMPAHRAKLIPQPNATGWGVVYLDTIIPGDAARDPRTIAAAQGDLSRVAGSEYAAQFGRAVRNLVGAKINDAAVKRTKDQLAGKTPDVEP